jgi:hypothetical protein
VYSITKGSLRTRRMKVNPSSQPSLPECNFPSFIKLPLEIRLKIWSMTAGKRRLILIRTSNNRLGFNSPAPVPASLHVCSESRQVALKIYKLSFGSRTDGFKSRVFFNFDQDTLYFGGYRDETLNYPQTCVGVFGTDIAEQERDQIQSLVVDVNTASFASWYIHVQQWKGLKDYRLCIEKPRLNIKSNLRLRELKGSEQWTFVKDYYREVNYMRIPRSLSLSDEIKKIEKWHLSPYSRLMDILAGNGGLLSLAIVVDT